MQMIDITVAHAQGPLLDWLVAKAAGRNPQDHLDLRDRVVTGDGFLFGSPSTNWDDAGALIDKHIVAMSSYENGQRFDAVTRHPVMYRMEGPTYLVAAMRAICRARLGQVVAVPATVVGVGL